MRPGKVDLHYFTLYSLKFHILPQLFLAFTKFQQIFQHHNFLIIVFPKIEISRPGSIFEKLLKIMDTGSLIILKMKISMIREKLELSVT